jgi:outer membrane receptor protein involved in Fe transport
MYRTGLGRVAEAKHKEMGMLMLRGLGPIAVSLVAGVALLCPISRAEAGDPSRAVSVDIPAQPLEAALRLLARQGDVQIMFAPGVAAGIEGPAVSGEMSVREALGQLLRATSLRYEVADKDTIVIKAKSRPGASSAPTSEGSAGANTGPLESSLQEIVVTAQKRSERLQDVPIPVTVISSESLVGSGQLRLQDYYTRIPGLTVAPDDFGVATVTIRGITTGDNTNPTVGITVDDIPYGSSTALGNGPEVPDFDPSDLSHIEVLRGPQGTLYGASSLGGLIKYVTVDPSTDAVSGRVEADLNDVYNGDGVGYGARAAVNVPLSDTVAVRASGFARRDAGYVNNVLTGQRGVNWGDAEGGRLSGLWRPEDGISLKINAMFENTTTHGSPNVEVGTGAVGAGAGVTTLGDLQQSNVRDIGGFAKRIQAYSAVFSADLGWATLKSLSGYSINQYSDSYDFSSTLGPLVQSGYPGTGFNGFGVGGAPVFVEGKTDKFTQELRLANATGSQLEWLVGLFYNHENSPANENIVAADPYTGIGVAQFAHIVYPSTFEEYAGFADVTYHFTQAFSLQLGARESENHQSYTESYTGPYDLVAFGEPGPYVQPTVYSKDNSFTYLVTPELKLAPDWMVYARLASGYRPGGPNINGASTGLPSEYRPDTTRNYELGTKAAFLDRTLSVDASLYYIDWKDIQLSLTAPVTGLSYNANGSSAKSQGVEISVEEKPLKGTTLGAWVAFNEAELTQGFPASSSALGSAGDPLPYSSRFSGSLSLDQEIVLTGRVTGVAGATLSYVGDREGAFAAAGTANLRQDLPAYAKTDLRAGIKWDAWNINLFANNVADKRGLLNGGLNTYNPNAFVFIQPRTVGVSVARSF